MGAILFLLFFLAIAPQSRAFIAGSLTATVARLHEWGAISPFLILTFASAPILSVVLMKLWPKREDPEDPMAHYRHEELHPE